MNFLSPAFLWFLPLVALPVIIHLLAKQKSRLIDFPSLIFLKRLEQDALRKFNIKQLILLIIRTLMILIVVLVFSRPNLDISTGFKLSTQTVDLLVIALDNTASNRERFDEQTGSWLEALSKDMKERGVRVRFCGISDFELVDTWKDITPEYSNVYVEDLDSRLAEQLDLSQYRRKSILWLGDGQDVADKLSVLKAWDKYLLWGTSSADRSLFSLSLPHRSILEDEIYRIGVHLGVLSNGPSTSLELMVNDKRVNQAIINAEDSYLEMSTRVDEPGFQEGLLELEQDEYRYNNSRHFVVKAGGRIPVQILRSNQFPDYWRVIESAIKVMEMNLDVRLLNYGRIDELNTKGSGTIIVDDASIIPDYTWIQLKSFVSNGGQLILFGNGEDQMQKLLGFKSPLASERSQASFAISHPMHQLNTLPLRDVILQNRLKVYKRYKTAGEELDETWLRYADDHPFLAEKDLGEGRILWFNTDFTKEANNLPLLGIFPTLILELCQFQPSQPTGDSYNRVIGDTLHFYPTAQLGGSSLFSIQRPDGTVDYQQPDSSFVVHYTGTNIPGIYRLVWGRRIIKPVAVNISSHEAQAHHKTYNFQDSGINIYKNQEALIAAVSQNQYGIALWPILLIILLLLMVIETYLSRIKTNWRQND